MFVCPTCGQPHPAAGVCGTDGTPLVDAGDDPLLGQTVGSYRIASLIGAGGMGSVYKGVNPSIGSRVAIKVLSEQCAADAKLVERFFAEARAVNLIRHENIVNVLDLAPLPDGRPYIVMEYLDGTPLTETMKRSGQLPIGGLTRLLQEVLGAVGAAHEKGIVHRDLKPDNIFVTPGGHAKVLDFGIAKLKPDLNLLSDETRTGAILGSPHYMSPEQAQGLAVDARADLYALGVILYQGVTGRRPFEGDSLYQLLNQQVEAPPPPPRSLRLDIPPGFEQLIARALEKDPARRFQTAAEFHAALSEASRHLPPESWAAVGSEPDTVVGGPPAGAVSSAVLTAPSPGAPPGVAVPPRTSGAHVPVAAPAPVASAPSPKSSSFPLLALAGCGGLLLVGLLVGAAFFFFARDTDPQIASGGTVATPMVQTPGVSMEPTEGMNLQRFDAFAFIADARGRARKIHGDAELAFLHLTGVRPDGTIDITAGQRLVNYRFRSEQRSQPPADFPSNDVYKGKCQVFVGVYPDRVHTFESNSTPCDTPIVGTPRCTLVDIWKRAQSLGAPTGNVIGSFTYMAPANKPTPQWIVQIEPGFARTLPDSCGSGLRLD